MRCRYCRYGVFNYYGLVQWRQPEENISGGGGQQDGRRVGKRQLNWPGDHQRPVKDATTDDQPDIGPTQHPSIPVDGTSKQAAKGASLHAPRSIHAPCSIITIHLLLPAIVIIFSPPTLAPFPSASCRRRFAPFPSQLTARGIRLSLLQPAYTIALPRFFPIVRLKLSALPSRVAALPRPVFNSRFGCSLQGTLLSFRHSTHAIPVARPSHQRKTHCQHGTPLQEPPSSDQLQLYGPKDVFRQESRGPRVQEK